MSNKPLHATARKDAAPSAPGVRQSCLFRERMKYKLISAMAHNWTHSFMSGMNYIDGDFVFEDVYRLVRDRRSVTITWIPRPEEELPAFTPRMRKSLASYRAALAEHLNRHNVEPSAISEMRTEVFMAENHQIHVRSYVLDSRGREHVQLVVV